MFILETEATVCPSVSSPGFPVVRIGIFNIYYIHRIIRFYLRCLTSDFLAGVMVTDTSLNFLKTLNRNCEATY